jgi:hypothetical protein
MQHEPDGTGAEGAAGPDPFFQGTLVRLVHASLTRRFDDGCGWGMHLHEDCEPVPPGTALLSSAAFVQGKERRDRLAKVLARRDTDPNNFSKMLRMARVDGICSAEISQNTCQKHGQVPKAEIMTIMDILGTNDHGPGLWIEVAGANHSCSPNSRFVRDGDVLSIVTLREVKPGTEIVCNDLPKRKMTRTQRRLLLKKGWGFDCQCALCESQR